MTNPKNQKERFILYFLQKFNKKKHPDY